jgi:1-acyl-sn-glycerol-3-phosphate acyltransferase
MPLPPLSDPRSITQRVRGLAVAVPATIFLLFSLIGFNALQTASLVLLPYSRRRFRSFNRWAADTWWGWCVTLGELLYHIEIIVTGDEVPLAENAIVIANHQQMPDITFLMAYARSKNRLGDLKWFVKDPIKYIPGVGWGMLFLDCVFVNRRWTKDGSSIQRTFARLKRDRVPLWLISFVEGTRLTSAKVKASRAYAEEHGLPLFEHVLIPRTKGFIATVKGLRDQVDAVYDITIGYRQGVPTLWQYIKGFSRVAHFHVRRHPIEQLPNDDDDALGKWLMRLFEEKDRLLDRYYRQGNFVGGTQGPPATLVVERGGSKR